MEVSIGPYIETAVEIHEHFNTSYTIILVSYGDRIVLGLQLFKLMRNTDAGGFICQPLPDIIKPEMLVAYRISLSIGLQQWIHLTTASLRLSL